MTAQNFEQRIVAWARGRNDIEALILAGSRAKQGAWDRLSDWDFLFITTQPHRYVGTAWLGEIAPCWCGHAARTPRGEFKISAFFQDGSEADFMAMAAWQMKLVYWAMRFPQKQKFMPARLRRGIQENRFFMLGTGYRLLVGTPAWEHRLSALQVPWPPYNMSVLEFSSHVSAFWQKSVSICTKIVRPEPRAAIHWLHLVAREHVYSLLAEEARLAGRLARPEARKAERWLDARRLAQTEILTSLEPGILAKALLGQIELFQDVSRSVATAREFPLPDYSAVAAWLRAELAKVQVKS